MRLYLKNSKFSKEIYPVTLAGGYVPTLGYEPLFPANEVENKAVEPAIWHKVLIIDWMSIDCEKKLIQWSSIKTSTLMKLNNVLGKKIPDVLNQCDNKAEPTKQRLSESVYIVSECALDDLDQVFMTVESLLEKVSQMQITEHEIYCSLFSMLHNYILPAVKLGKSDIPSIELAIVSIKECLAKKNNEILNLTEKTEKIEAAVRKLRRQFIDEIINAQSESKENIVLKYSIEFLYRLHQDIKIDIDHSADILNKLQYNVQEAKLSNSSVDDSNEHLIILRKERDKYYSEEYVQLLEGREILHGILHGFDAALLSKTEQMIAAKKSSNLNLKENRNDKVNLYNGSMEHLQVFYKDAQRLGIQKVLISSVREALTSSLEILQNGEVISIFDDNVLGHRPTDVLRWSRIPSEWLSIDAFVARILEKDIKLKEDHKKFCFETREYCHKVVDMHKARQQKKMLSNNKSEQDEVKQNAATLQSTENTYDIIVSEETAMLCNDDKSSSLPNGCNSSNVSILRKSKSDSLKSRSTKSPVNLEALLNSDFIGFADLSILDDEHDAFVILSAQKDIMRPSLDHLKLIVHTHIRKMSENVMLSWHEKSEFIFRKIWLAYEKHLYNDIIDEIVCMYNECYANIVQTFKTFLPQLTMADLDIHDEGMHDLLCITKHESLNDENLSENNNSNVKAPVSLSSLNRNTWPIQQTVLLYTDRTDVESEILLDEFALQSLDSYVLDDTWLNGNEHSIQEVSNNNSNDKDLVNNQLNHSKHERFSVAVAYLSELLEMRTLLLKMRLLECCVREVDLQVRQYKREMNKKSVGITADDIVDVLSYLICSCDVNVAANLYPQLMMLIDLMPTFMEAGPASFSLTNFVVTYNSLQDRIVLKKKCA